MLLCLGRAALQMAMSDKRYRLKKAIIKYSNGAET